MNIIRSIQNRIYELRGERVILDQDLANLYVMRNALAAVQTSTDRHEN
jgi:hypothetical protein